ncbi:NAD-glutamate dehydrogenase domain-containing protein [Nocardia sp. NPDC059246]|uniref:NAD-glutamate dehydrogenase domain-containing protein n=1 Tax=unclassified Nocardia TaxID=2637762 RepID=UPI0036982078
MVLAYDLTDFTSDDWDQRVVHASTGRGITGSEIQRWLEILPPAYKIATSSSDALADFIELDRLADGNISLNIDAAPDQSAVQLRLRLRSRAATVTLSQIVPVLHSMDHEVLYEHAYAIGGRDRDASWIHDIGLQINGAHRGLRSNSLTTRISDTLTAIWGGRCEADGFNALVTHSGLTYQQANLVRAYAAYLRQLGTPYSTDTVLSVLRKYPDTASRLIDLFHTRFDPDRHQDGDGADLVKSITAEIAAVTSLDADRILRALLTVIQATVRTNYFRTAEPLKLQALALKLDTARIPFAPQPRPSAEIFVYSPHVEGVHLRFGKVSRGGLRWSDRRDDYRTEILGLAKAQTVKNAVIVPVGAKGGFVVKTPGLRHLTSTGTPGEGTSGVAGYRTFVSALLSITDNLDPATRCAVTPDRVIAYDGDDTYLVVAADKGTATFSDIANSIAAEHGFWLGDAFASGGSVGYDHKRMGITARGAWESVIQHFRELGHEITNSPTTVVGIGDMSGDVFGNWMLLSRHLQLVAAFDHRHIFVDPNPDPATSYTERARLFGLSRSSWADYNPALLSAGGFISSRVAKRISLTAAVRSALGIDETVTALTPAELISAILSAPVDLIWNGGIGTYVKATTETHADVGDKANDTVRINGNQLRARVVGEGGNLGLTQLGRIEYARAGGRVNTDALDNSAGVNCSDHEVNIKIVLDAAVRSGILDLADRASFLESMTDVVAELVLTDNRRQNEILGIHRSEAAVSVALHARLAAHLQNDHGLDRDLAGLPGSTGFAALRKAQTGLSGPELAQLIAHVKLALKAEIVNSPAIHSLAFTSRFIHYFPGKLTESYPGLIRSHPLRNAITATEVVNDMVDAAGITFAFRLREEIGADGVDAATAFVCATDIFGVHALLNEIREAEPSLALPAANELRAQTRRLIDRAARWLLANRPQPIATDSQISRYRDRIRLATPKVRTWLHREEAEALDNRIANLVSLGAPEHLAARVAELMHTFCLLDICDISDIVSRDTDEVAELYFTVSEQLRINYYLTAVTSLPRQRRWESLARLALREELYHAVRAIVLDVLTDHHANDGTTTERVAKWNRSNRARLTRATRLLSEIPPFTSEPADMSTLVVAVRRIRSLIRAPEPQP